MLRSDMKQDVVCIGSALLDIYLKSDKFKQIPSGVFEGGIALCEEFGAKTEVDEVKVTSGGGGTNNAVSYARKGFAVSLIAELGKDLIAAAICSELAQEGVDLTGLIQEKSEDTGLSSIMVSSDGARSVAVYRGACALLTKSDINWDTLNPNWIHLSSLGCDMELYEGLIGHAKANNINIIVNPGSYEIEHKDEWGGLSLYQDVNILLLNRQEATQLSGINFLDEDIWLKNQCLPGPKITIITDGRRGGKVCADGTCVWYQALDTNVVEETGAGDAFGSGFTAAIMKDLELETAIEWGRRQSSSVVQHIGPKAGLLSLEAIKSKHD